MSLDRDSKLDDQIARQGGVKCYLIDPDAETISPAGLTDLGDALLEALSTEDTAVQMFSAVRIGQGHVLVVDDNFRSNGVTPFRHAAYPHPLGGRAVVLAANGPEWESPNLSIEDMAASFSTGDGRHFEIGAASSELIGSAPASSIDSAPFSFSQLFRPKSAAVSEDKTPAPSASPAPAPFSFSQLFRAKPGIIVVGRPPAAGKPKPKL